MLKYFLGGILIRAAIMREYKGEIATQSPIGDELLSYWLPQKGEQYRVLINQSADANWIPRPVLAALLNAESAFNPSALSPVGAQGIAQFMPETARELGVDPWNPDSAIPGAARYLRWCIDYMDGSIEDGVAAYNWGVGNMANYRAGKIKQMPLETIAYLTKVYYTPMLIGV